MQKKYVIAPLSNGNIALMANLARFGRLPWDAILGAELVKHYKPDNEVYLSAPYFLGLKPEEVMMCAAHSTDLNAAHRNGLRTGFIYRPDEFGNGSAGVPDKAKPGDFTLSRSARSIWLGRWVLKPRSRTEGPRVDKDEIMDGKQNVIPAQSRFSNEIPRN